MKYRIALAATVIVATLLVACNTSVRTAYVASQEIGWFKAATTRLADQQLKIAAQYAKQGNLLGCAAIATDPLTVRALAPAIANAALHLTEPEVYPEVSAGTPEVPDAAEWCSAQVSTGTTTVTVER